MIVTLIIAFWAASLLLTVGLCAAARRGDAQLRQASVCGQAASALAPAASADPPACADRLGADRPGAQTGADLALQSG